MRLKSFSTVKKVEMITSKTDKPNVRLCPCCGQERPFPTEAGLWEFKHYWEEDDKWKPCEIKVCTEDTIGADDCAVGCLLFYCKSERDEEDNPNIPKWWPDDTRTMWRKL
jgi:hypothetical protein